MMHSILLIAVAKQKPHNSQRVEFADE